MLGRVTLFMVPYPIQTMATSTIARNKHEQTERDEVFGTAKGNKGETVMEVKCKS